MDRMLVIVVDGSVNLSSYWDNVKTILESIVRRFCANANDASTSSHPCASKYDLSLIVNALLYDSAVQSDGITTLDSFLYSLSHLYLDDDSQLGKSVVSEGLSMALTLLELKQKQQTQLFSERHCVLVTASHHCTNAETLGRSFTESFISLSVICPRDMPQGNIVQLSDTIAIKHPRLLLFISDRFPEAREAVEKFAAENHNSTDFQQDPLVFTVNFSDEEYMFLKQIFFQPQMEQQKEYENMQIIAGNNSSVQQGMPTEYLQDELNVAAGSVQITPEEMDGFYTSISRDIIPFQAVCSNFVAHSRDFNTKKQEEMADLLSYQVHFLERTATSSSNHASQMSIPKQINTFHLSTSWLLKNDPENILKNGSKYNSNTSMQIIGHNSSREKMVLSANNQIASMSNPTPKHVISTNNAHPVSSTNHSVTSRVTNDSSSSTSCHLKEPQPSATPLLSSDCVFTGKFSLELLSGHMKAWEGSITSRGSGVNIFVGKLVAYKKATVPEKIFENWPKMMQLDHLGPHTQLPNSLIQVNKIPLVFSVLDSCPIWDLMKEKMLCGYVDLPGQMLRLWTFEDKGILIGTLFEGIMYNQLDFMPY